MIALINGLLIRLRDNGTAIVRNEPTNIGYEVIAPAKLDPTYASEGKSVGWWIFHYISQDRQALYAFEFEDERELAIQMTKVQGVGMGIAHKVVTTHGHDTVVDAIRDGDVKSLCADVKGFGPKMGTKVIDHLRKSFQALAAGGGDPRIPRVKAALKQLGIGLPNDAELAELCRTDPDASDADLVKAISSAK